MKVEPGNVVQYKGAEEGYPRVKACMFVTAKLEPNRFVKIAKKPHADGDYSYFCHGKPTCPCRDSTRRGSRAWTLAMQERNRVGPYYEDQDNAKHNSSVQLERAAQ